MSDADRSVDDARRPDGEGNGRKTPRPRAAVGGREESGGSCRSAGERREKRRSKKWSGGGKGRSAVCRGESENGLEAKGDDAGHRSLSRGVEISGSRERGSGRSDSGRSGSGRDAGSGKSGKRHYFVSAGSGGDHPRRTDKRISGHPGFQGVHDLGSAIKRGQKCLFLDKQSGALDASRKLGNKEKRERAISNSHTRRDIINKITSRGRSEIYFTRSADGYLRKIHNKSNDVMKRVYQKQTLASSRERTGCADRSCSSSGGSVSTGSVDECDVAGGVWEEGAVSPIKTDKRADDTQTQSGRGDGDGADGRFREIEIEEEPNVASTSSSSATEEVSESIGSPSGSAAGADFSEMRELVEVGGSVGVMESVRAMELCGAMELGGGMESVGVMESGGEMKSGGVIESGVVMESVGVIKSNGVMDSIETVDAAVESAFGIEWIEKEEEIHDMNFGGSSNCESNLVADEEENQRKTKEQRVVRTKAFDFDAPAVATHTPTSASGESDSNLTTPLFPSGVDSATISSPGVVGCNAACGAGHAFGCGAAVAAAEKLPIPSDLHFDFSGSQTMSTAVSDTSSEGCGRASVIAATRCKSSMPVDNPFRRRESLKEDQTAAKLRPNSCSYVTQAPTTIITSPSRDVDENRFQQKSNEDVRQAFPENPINYRSAKSRNVFTDNNANAKSVKTLEQTTDLEELKKIIRQSRANLISNTEDRNEEGVDEEVDDREENGNDREESRRLSDVHVDEEEPDFRVDFRRLESRRASTEKSTTTTTTIKSESLRRQYHSFDESWHLGGGGGGGGGGYSETEEGAVDDNDDNDDDDDDENEDCGSDTSSESAEEYDDDEDEGDDEKEEDDLERGGSEKEEVPEELKRTTQLVFSFQQGKMIPKLKEPRNLYTLNAKEFGPQQESRWPYEIQVLRTRVKHIPNTPEEGEPLYKLTGLEKVYHIRGLEGGGRVVYCYEPIMCSYFMRSRVAGSRTVEECAVKLTSPEDKTLIFEARFESGNLQRAVQVGEYDYELTLRTDLYTPKHTQWYYFRCSNVRAGVTYRFTITNLMKPDSLYNQGMRPLMYSEKDAASRRIGWRRVGENIKYYRNNIKVRRDDGSKGPDRFYYSLTWTCTFPYSHDTCYFAHCYPYTYSDLQDYLLELAHNPLKSRICKQRVFCRTLAGNLVYILTITSPANRPEEMKHKKAVILTARVHPGESNSSWMMKGFLDYLTSDSPDAKFLRDRFIFKIIPMLNPDGVIVGNYRCSLAGRDLNRNYKSVLKDSFPSVWHTKAMIRRMSEERDVVVYCDLHGHSRRQNIFIYGCENVDDPEIKLKERIFPLLVAQKAPDKFCFDSCKFKIQKSKEGTGRIVMWNLGILNSFTLEASFCGSTLSKRRGTHFNILDYEAMGFHFLDALVDFCDASHVTRVESLLEELVLTDDESGEGSDDEGVSPESDMEPRQGATAGAKTQRTGSGSQTQGRTRANPGDAKKDRALSGANVTITPPLINMSKFATFQEPVVKTNAMRPAWFNCEGNLVSGFCSSPLISLSGKNLHSSQSGQNTTLANISTKATKPKNKEPTIVFASDACLFDASTLSTLPTSSASTLQHLASAAASAASASVSAVLHGDQFFPNVTSASSSNVASANQPSASFSTSTSNSKTQPFLQAIASNHRSVSPLLSPQPRRPLSEKARASTAAAAAKNGRLSPLVTPGGGAASTELSVSANAVLETKTSTQETPITTTELSEAASALVSSFNAAMGHAGRRAAKKSHHGNEANSFHNSSDNVAKHHSCHGNHSEQSKEDSNYDNRPDASAVKAPPSDEKTTPLNHCTARSDDAVASTESTPGPKRSSENPLTPGRAKPSSPRGEASDVCLHEVVRKQIVHLENLKLNRNFGKSGAVSARAASSRSAASLSSDGSNFVAAGRKRGIVGSAVKRNDAGGNPYFSGGAAYFGALVYQNSMPRGSGAASAHHAASHGVPGALRKKSHATTTSTRTAISLDGDKERSSKSKDSVRRPAKDHAAAEAADAADAGRGIRTVLSFDAALPSMRSDAVVDVIFKKADRKEATKKGGKSASMPLVPSPTGARINHARKSAAVVGK